jgi:hypothetical protein
MIPPEFPHKSGFSNAAITDSVHESPLYIGCWPHPAMQDVSWLNVDARQESSWTANWNSSGFSDLAVQEPTQMKEFAQ